MAIRARRWLAGTGSWPTGVCSWLSLILVIAAPVLILVTFALHTLLWVAVVAVVLLVLAAVTGGIVLRTDGTRTGMPAIPAGRAQFGWAGGWEARNLRFRPVIRMILTSDGPGEVT